MYISTYLTNKLFFDTFEDVKNYYNHSEAKDVDELNEALQSDYDGMVSPVVGKI